MMLGRQGDRSFALRSLEGEPGNPPASTRLHELLDAQVYRLSYWRIAAEEINYRRFFDINTFGGDSRRNS